VAIFHLSVKCLSRSKGHSAVAAAAYRAGVRLLDARTGELSDYTRRRGVVATRVHLPAGAPALDRQALWDAAEAAENRKNSTVARECELALPAELPRHAQVGLADQLNAQRDTNALPVLLRQLLARQELISTIFSNLIA
jgi:hypothetical protein